MATIRVKNKFELQVLKDACAQSIEIQKSHAEADSVAYEDRLDCVQRVCHLTVAEFILDNTVYLNGEIGIELPHEVYDQMAAAVNIFCDVTDDSFELDNTSEEHLNLLIAAHRLDERLN